MIYTVTFNPSLDYVVQARYEADPGEINRTTSEHIYPGGKGNNVSVILSNLDLRAKRLDSRQDLPEMYWKRCWKSSDVRQILSR